MRTNAMTIRVPIRNTSNGTMAAPEDPKHGGVDIKVLHADVKADDQPDSWGIFPVFEAEILWVI